MWKLAILVSCAFCCVQAKVYQNPVLEGLAASRPSVAVKDNVYYMVTQNFFENSTSQNWIAIHASRDLQDWTHIGYVFDETTFPKWAKKAYGLSSPSIHYRSGSFYILFEATPETAKENVMSVSIATSSSIFGPFSTPQTPFPMVSENMSEFFPSLLLNQKAYLLYGGTFGITAREVNITDFSFVGEAELLIRKTEEWEILKVIAPKYTYRNNYHYIFYSSGAGCIGTYREVSAIGVARSKNIFGPYEKFLEPILETNLSEIWGTAYGSVLEDASTHTDVIVYGGIPVGANNCQPSEIRILPLEWNSQYWPAVKTQSQ